MYTSALKYPKICMTPFRSLLKSANLKEWDLCEISTSSLFQLICLPLSENMVMHSILRISMALNNARRDASVAQETVLWSILRTRWPRLWQVSGGNQQERQWQQARIILERNSLWKFWARLMSGKTMSRSNKIIMTIMIQKSNKLRFQRSLKLILITRTRFLNEVWNREPSRLPQTSRESTDTRFRLWARALIHQRLGLRCPMALRSTDTETRKTISTRCKKIRCERL